MMGLKELANDIRETKSNVERLDGRLDGIEKDVTRMVGYLLPNEFTGTKGKIQEIQFKHDLDKSELDGKHRSLDHRLKKIEDGDFKKGVWKTVITAVTSSAVTAGTFVASKSAAVKSLLLLLFGFSK